MQNSKVTGIMHRIGLKGNKIIRAQLQFVCGNQGWKYLADTLKIKTKANQEKNTHLYLKNKMQKQFKASFQRAQVKPRFSIARS